MTTDTQPDIVERLRSRAWEDRHHRKYREEAAAEITRLRAEVEALRRDATNWREVVPMLLDELDARDYRLGNAPGHSHDVPGVWDDDNGDLAGKPCAWCATWNAALKEHTNGRSSATL